MYSRIMIPLDGSRVAEQVLPLAGIFAARLKSSVVLFHALEPVQEVVRVEGEMLYVDQQLKILQNDTQVYLEKIRAAFKDSDVRVDCRTLVGFPSSTILEFAESEHIDLIAMTTHGRTGIQRRVYGSVADRLLTGGTKPILLVRASASPTTPQQIKKILVPLDGSELAEQALATAQCLADAFDSELFLVRVLTELGNETAPDVATKYLTETAARLESKSARTQWNIRSGDVANAVLNAARDHDANLVVMSTHGRSGISRWVMGSVADRVLRASEIPVLLVRSKLRDD